MSEDKTNLMLNMSKDCHSNDWINEGYQSQECSNVEKGREGDNEGKEELSDAFGCLDEPENPAYPEDPHNSKQGRRDREICH